MPEKQRTLTYQSEDGLIRLRVVRANAVIGMKRSIQQVHGAEAVREESDEALRVLRAISYPDLVSAVLWSEGRIQIGDNQVLDLADHWPVTFEEFCTLPDDLIVAWEQAVYALNPHWNPAGEPDDTVEKKDENLTGA